MSDAARYPDELSQTVTATDGTAVFLRAIRPEDAERLVAFYGRLSEHTAYQRFFTVMKRLPPDWARMLATVDYVKRLALVAEVQTPGGLELVAVARYEPTARADTVEVAFVVQDAWQNKGLGTILFQALLRAAQARGFQRFSAYVLATNRRMLDLISRFATVVERTLDHGVIEATFTAKAPASPKRARGPAVLLLVAGLSLVAAKTPAAEAGCRGLDVPPHPGREQGALDPDRSPADAGHDSRLTRTASWRAAREPHTR